MKLTVTLFLMVLSTGIIYGGTVNSAVNQKAIVAKVCSMIEGQMIFEVPLGSHVTKRQLVEEVDPKAYHAKVLEDSANISLCKELFKEASQQIKGHAISKEDFVSAKCNLTTALEQYKIDRELEKHCKVYAPFDGVVTSITTYPGSGMGDGNTIMTIQKDGTGATIHITKQPVAQMVSMIEGQIKYEVALGSHVKKGQLVEEVDPTAFHSQVIADVANIVNCKQIYNDSSNMIKSHAVSLQEHTQNKYNLINAYEKLVGDRELEKHCKIYAPFDGVVTSITTYPGSGIGDGNTIMTIKKSV
jgi:multidrug resistance efflux pump